MYGRFIYKGWLWYLSVCVYILVYDYNGVKMYVFGYCGLMIRVEINYM